MNLLKEYLIAKLLIYRVGLTKFLEVLVLLLKELFWFGAFIAIVILFSVVLNDLLRERGIVDLLKTIVYFLCSSIFSM